GVRITPSTFVLPPTPPPDIDLEAWEDTLAEIERRAPARLALTHFGVFDDVERHLAELRGRLARWADWVRRGLTQEQFVSAAEAGRPPRCVLIASAAANLAVPGLMGALLVTHHAHLWQLVVLQLVGGAATAFHSPASSGLVPQTVPAELLRQANSYMGVARYSANILGAAVGGALVATIGSGWAILLDGTTYLASAVLL